MKTQNNQKKKKGIDNRTWLVTVHVAFDHLWVARVSGVSLWSHLPPLHSPLEKKVTKHSLHLRNCSPFLIFKVIKWYKNPILNQLTWRQNKKPLLTASCVSFLEFFSRHFQVTIFISTLPPTPHLFFFFLFKRGDHIWLHGIYNFVIMPLKKIKQRDCLITWSDLQSISKALEAFSANTASLFISSISTENSWSFFFSLLIPCIKKKEILLDRRC